MKKQRGFTLIELLVVIVIIGIIAAIAVPRFLASQDRAYVTAAVADVDHFRKALAVYEIDYGAFPDQNFGNVSSITAALIDPSGNDYMILPDGQNFSSFPTLRSTTARATRFKSLPRIIVVRGYRRIRWEPQCNKSRQRTN